MPIAITPETTWEWQLPEDRAEDGSIDPEKTTVTLKALTVQQEAQLEDMAATLIVSEGTATEGKMHTGTVALKTLEYGLFGWKEFFYADGKPVPFRKENFGAWSGEHRKQIANAITERQHVTADEKN